MARRAPKVFVSHASIDKQLFVRDFAEQLEANGVQVWLDEWNLSAGDSLPREISNNIVDSDAVVIVLSNEAVGRPWVVEELDSAKYQQVVNDKLLIPVILGELSEGSIPASVLHLLQIRVSVVDGVVQVSESEAAVQNVLRSVFNLDAPRPARGSPPTYVSELAVVDGLDSLETAVLRVAGEIADDQGHHGVQTERVIERVASELDVTEDQVLDALEVLEIDGYIAISRVMHSERVGRLRHLQFTRFGLNVYFSTFVSEEAQLTTELIAAIANGPDQSSLTRLNVIVPDATLLLIRTMLQNLETDGLVLLSKGIGGPGRYQVKSRAGIQRRLRN